LSLIGRTELGLLYVVFLETAEGRLRILHARLAESSAEAVEPEFEFDARRMKRVPRPERHIATAADVSPRNCRVKVSLELDADIVAAFRERSVNEALRALLNRVDAKRIGDDTLIEELSRRVRREARA
jgi:uncharacterized protein (DUF4415 family)